MTSLLHRQRDLYGQWWKALKAKRELLSLDAPKGSHEQSQPVGMGSRARDGALPCSVEHLDDKDSHAGRERMALATGTAPRDDERVTPTSATDRMSMWARFVNFPTPTLRRISTDNRPSEGNTLGY